MPRFFNNAGPCKPEKHYTIDPLSRFDWNTIRDMIDQERYFVLHAPRQTGKSSALLKMMDLMNAEGKYAVCYANVEGGQAARERVDEAITGICDGIAHAVRIYLKDNTLQQWLRENKSHIAATSLLNALLTQWAEQSDKPTVLFIDEVDTLVGDSLISLLRQIRAGYTQRPQAFPQSIVLCGVRDVRDYRMQQGDGQIITGGSAFNIKAASLLLSNFSLEQCKALWQQHTDETGQTFDEAIYPELWLDTAGQPWLVNTLALEMVQTIRDRSVHLTLEHYYQAREKLIQSRTTHLEQLTDKLKEARVHSVISKILAGDTEQYNFPHDDLSYCEDLGLIKLRPHLQISNRIYQEVIPRELTWSTQVTIANQDQAWYIKADGSLDMPKLLTAFQAFFRENSESWMGRFDYAEAGPQLLMQAFLQRIINGGGRISREYALGRKRTDLYIQWPLDKEKNFFGPVQRIVIELKIQRGALETEIEKGLVQVREYGQTVKADELHLVIFNRKPEVNWDEKIWQQMRDDVRVWAA